MGLLSRVLPRYLPGAQKPLTEEEQRQLLAQVQENTERPRYVAPPLEGTPKPVVTRPDMPVYSPATPITDEAALIERPTQPYPSSLNPATGTMSEEERNAITRPRMAVQPEAPDAATEPPPTGPTVQYGDQGQPRGAQGGADDYERNQAYLRALQGYKPEDHNGRLKSMLLGFARGLQGERGQSLLSGAIDTASDEKYANRQEIGRVGSAVATEQASRKATQDIENDRAASAYKLAQAHREMNPVYAPEVVDTEGGYSRVDKNTGQATPVYDPQGNRLKKPKTATSLKTEVRHDPKTGRAEKWTIGENGEPDKKIEGWSDPAKDLVKRDGMWVPQGTALTAGALGAQRTQVNTREDKRDSRHASERSEDKSQQQQEKFQARQQKAGEITGRLDAARTRWIAADAKVSELKTRLEAETDAEKKQDVQDLISRWEYDRTRAATEAQGAATELSTSYGDMFEAGPGKGGLAYYQRRPWTLATWRTRNPGVKPDSPREKAAIQAAKDAGLEVVQ